MNGFSTITEKGQVVIPQSIRDALQLKPATRVYLEIKDDAVVVKPVLSINQAFGMFKTSKKASQADYDKAVEEAVIEKFKIKLTRKTYGLS